MTALVPSVPLYTLHMSEAGQIRAILTTVKSMLDNPNFRQNLINLNVVQANIIELPYPMDLIGRLEKLSESIQAFETTVSTIEDGIRGSLNYPVVS